MFVILFSKAVIFRTKLCVRRTILAVSTLDMGALLTGPAILPD